MSYIQPTSDIELMIGVPLPSTLEHTIWFPTRVEQDLFFGGFVHKSFTNQTYQRVNSNVCRVEVNAGEVYGCNYMRFRNRSFGNKYFYAFITSVEYVNNNVTEITYELDEIQSWITEMQLGQCFIERQHSVTDEVGDNLLPEPVQIDENIVDAIESAGYNDMSIIMNVVFDDSVGEE